MENKRPFKTIYTCFPQGKHKVLTMSYDDGKIFDRKLIEIFNKYGIKGTFHLNTGIMPVMRTEYSFRKSRNFTKATKYRAIQALTQLSSVVRLTKLFSK